MKARGPKKQKQRIKEPQSTSVIRDREADAHSAAGGAEEMRLLLEGDIKDGHIEKGELKEYKGSSCREWSITRFTERNQLGSYTACLGETDPLPRYMRSANENFTIYFEWEPPVVIEPPDMNASTMEYPATL